MTYQPEEVLRKFKTSALRHTPLSIHAMDDQYANLAPAVSLVVTYLNDLAFAGEMSHSDIEIARSDKDREDFRKQVEPVWNDLTTHQTKLDEYVPTILHRMRDPAEDKDALAREAIAEFKRLVGELESRRTSLIGELEAQIRAAEAGSSSFDRLLTASSTILGEIRKDPQAGLSLFRRHLRDARKTLAALRTNTVDLPDNDVGTLVRNWDKALTEVLKKPDAKDASKHGQTIDELMKVRELLEENYDYLQEVFERRPLDLISN